MELLFLGRGAAFYPEEGSNSAFFFDNDELFLIDCGETTFLSIIDNNLLDGVDNVNIFITHTHSDHVGSLGTLIMYLYYNLGKKAKVIVPGSDCEILGALKLYECNNICDVLLTNELSNNYSSFYDVNYVETIHTDNKKCYGLVFNTESGIVYYSGDTKSFDTIKNLIKNKKIIDKIYLDASNKNFENNPHLYIGDIKRELSGLESKIYCMHFNSSECIAECEALGFNVVKRYGKTRVLKK